MWKNLEPFAGFPIVNTTEYLNEDFYLAATYVRLTAFTGSKITTLKLQCEKENALTTNRAVYVVAVDRIVLSQDLDNSFEL